MNILVTGSSGFVAQALVPELKKLGFDVIGIDWKTGEYTDIIQDISKPFKIEKKLDIIIHLAARLEHERCSKQDFFSSNVTGTKNVLEIAKQNDSFFIYVSTDAIYGSPDSPITEETRILPETHYGITKFKGEEICRKYEQDSLKITIVRSHFIIGEKRSGVFNLVFKNLFKNSIIPILGNGENKISFVNIEDFTEFIIHIVQQKIFGITVNVGGLIPGNFNHVILELKKYTKSNSKIIHIPTFFTIFLKFLSLLKLIPLTPWQLSMMQKDYYCDNKFLFSTGLEYKFQPMPTLKAMADNYKFNLKK